MVDYTDVVPKPDKDGNSVAREAVDAVQNLQFESAKSVSRSLANTVISIAMPNLSPMLNAIRKSLTIEQIGISESVKNLNNTIASIFSNFKVETPQKQIEEIAKTVAIATVLDNQYFGKAAKESIRQSAESLKHIDEAFQSIWKNISEASRLWLPDIGQLRNTLKKYGLRYPGNMEKALGNDYDRDWLTTVLYEEGIPLYKVPSPRIISRLRTSGSQQTHRSILGRELSSISADCRLLIRLDSRNTKERGVSRLIEESIAVISEGHLAAGMALLSSVLDLLINVRLPVEEKHRIKPYGDTVKKMSDVPDELKGNFQPNGKPIIELVENYGDLPDRIALYPLLSAYRQMYDRVKVGHTIEIGYSRHAIAHRPSAKLFTKANAAQALLCATSLAAYVYQW